MDVGIMVNYSSKQPQAEILEGLDVEMVIIKLFTENSASYKH